MFRHGERDSQKWREQSYKGHTNVGDSEVWKLIENSELDIFKKYIYN